MHTNHKTSAYNSGLDFILKTSLIPYGCSYWFWVPLVLLIQLSPDGFEFSLCRPKETAACKKWVKMGQEYTEWEGMKHKEEA